MTSPIDVATEHWVMAFLVPGPEAEPKVNYNKALLEFCSIKEFLPLKNIWFLFSIYTGFPRKTLHAFRKLTHII